MHGNFNFMEILKTVFLRENVLFYTCIGDKRKWILGVVFTFGSVDFTKFFHIVSHMGITLTNVGSIVNGFYTPREKKFTDLGLRPRSVNFPPLGCKIH